MNLQFSALSQNESFARVTVASFITQLDPTMDELTEIKTVVSEAVTNAIIHGYESNPDGVVYISVTLHEDGPSGNVSRLLLEQLIHGQSLSARR